MNSLNADSSGPPSLTVHPMPWCVGSTVVGQQRYTASQRVCLHYTSSSTSPRRQGQLIWAVQVGCRKPQGREGHSLTGRQSRCTEACRRVDWAYASPRGSGRRASPATSLRGLSRRLQSQTLAEVQGNRLRAQTEGSAARLSLPFQLFDLCKTCYSSVRPQGVKLIGSMATCQAWGAVQGRPEALL